MIANLHPAWAAEWLLKEAIPAAIRDGIWSGETALLHADGREIPLSQVVAVHKNSDGAVEFLSTIARDISERKRAEEQIKSSLREKEVLLQEIHHRVNNNLQIISSLLNLQSQSVQDQAERAIFQESQDRVRSMALVHEQLYRSKDLASIEASEYLQAVTANLFRSYCVNPSLIKLRVEMDQLKLGIKTAIPCGLLINELVSNALKHAFPNDRAGEVRVELRSLQDGQFLLRVSDDGIGLPQGLDMHRTQSLGLRLINTLSKQLGGSVQLGPGPGTTLEVRFAGNSTAY
jgi:two-component sensor histidine kinase